MRFPSRTAKWVPAALGTAMSLVIVAAVVAPNIGVVSAQTTCQYGTCTSSGPTTMSYILLGVLIAVIVAAAIVFLLYRRSRSGGGGGGLTPYELPPAGAAGGPAAETMPVEPAMDEGGTAADAGYVETPEDVGAPLPEAAVPAAPVTPPGGEGDIDSLMQELDKISGEILKRGPAKARPPSAGGAADASGGAESGEGDTGGAA